MMIRAPFLDFDFLATPCPQPTAAGAHECTSSSAAITIDSQRPQPPTLLLLLRDLTTAPYVCVPAARVLYPISECVGTSHGLVRSHVDSGAKDVTRRQQRSMIGMSNLAQLLAMTRKPAGPRYWPRSLPRTPKCSPTPGLACQHTHGCAIPIPMCLANEMDGPPSRPMSPHQSNDWSRSAASMTPGSLRGTGRDFSRPHKQPAPIHSWPSLRLGNRIPSTRGAQTVLVHLPIMEKGGRTFAPSFQLPSPGLGLLSTKPGLFLPCFAPVSGARL